MKVLRLLRPGLHEALAQHYRQGWLPALVLGNKVWLRLHTANPDLGCYCIWIFREKFYMLNPTVC